MLGVFLGVCNKELLFNQHMNNSFTLCPKRQITHQLSRVLRYRSSTLINRNWHVLLIETILLGGREVPLLHEIAILVES